MKFSTKIKMVVATILIFFAAYFSISVARASLRAVDTEVRIELAMEQMTNEEESSALYEEYRNVSNDINALPSIAVVVCTTIGVIAVMFIPEITKLVKEKNKVELGF